MFDAGNGSDCGAFRQKPARLVLTNSGSIQKEAYWLKVLCITLRDETEWVETVEAGWNVVVGADMDRIIQAVQSLVVSAERLELYGNGQTAVRCAALFEEDCK